MSSDGSIDAQFTRLRRQFSPEGVYLDTPTYGLPSDAVVAVMHDAVDRWRRGVATTRDFDDAVRRSRALFAELVGVTPSDVAVASQVSVLVGSVAASLPDGSHVLAVADDFASLLYPFLVQRHRGITVRTVALEDLPDAVDATTDLVACSLVQSSDGRIADLDALLAAAERFGAQTLVDATHAAGWLPVDASRVDYLVVAAYKWLLSPRGTAFLTIREQRLDEFVPVNAGWYAGEDVWGSIYGDDMVLARSARRADVSPAWLSWMGTVPALELIHEIGVERINEHDVALADMVRHALGLPPSASAIVSIPTRDPVDVADAGISGSVRAGSLRVGCHLYNDVSDIEALVAAVVSEVTPGRHA